MKFKKLVLSEPTETVATPKTKAAKSKQTEAPLKEVIAGSNDFYGANSLENFSSASGLTYTHEDAKGFLDYPTSFAGKAANFWFKDPNVQVWGYEETYDNWQDSYGMDSVMAFYHSGHGNMDGNGVFQAPLGAKWDSRDWAFSDRMAFANEELRYLFWSTCYSLRVSGPDNPVRSWWGPNKGGLRMLFGYETTSIDHSGYGKFFWEEWNKGKTFARAFLDASWRISHNQVPVVMASGATQAEATNRLNTERVFSRAAATKGWYQWQWIGTLPTRSFAAKMATPKEMNAIILDSNQFTDERIAKMANLMGATKTQAETILFDANGNRAISSKNLQVNVNKDGALNMHFNQPTAKNSQTIDEEKAVDLARGIVKDLGFDKDVELTLGNTRNKFTCGGSQKGSGTMDSPSVLETIIQFRQTHNGIESVNSDHGLITVAVDNDGKITNLYNSTRPVRGESKLPSAVVTPPKAKTSERASVEEVFENKISRIVNAASGNGIAKKAIDKATLLNEKIGYDFSDNLGVIVQQKDVEVTFENEFKKRYKLRVPIMG